MQSLQVEKQGLEIVFGDESGGRFLEAGNLDTEKDRENGTP